jgi:hypothetical protein
MNFLCETLWLKLLLCVICVRILLAVLPPPPMLGEDNQATLPLNASHSPSYHIGPTVIAADRLRKVIDQRVSSIPTMLCSQSWRAAPVR